MENDPGPFSWALKSANLAVVERSAGELGKVERSASELLVRRMRKPEKPKPYKDICGKMRKAKAQHAAKEPQVQPQPVNLPDGASCQIGFSEAKWVDAIRHLAFSVLYQLHESRTPGKGELTESRTPLYQLYESRTSLDQSEATGSRERYKPARRDVNPCGVPKKTLQKLCTDPNVMLSSHGKCETLLERLEKRGIVCCDGIISLPSRLAMLGKYGPHVVRSSVWPMELD